MRILVVEDDPGIGELLCDDLAGQGYAVDWARDGEQALAFQGSYPFDLVILDIMLPRLDGFEVIRRLRDRRQAVPVLMLTARDGVDDRIKGLDLGADDYLVKPFHLAELRARVRALVRRSQGEASNRIHVGAITLDSNQQRVWHHDKKIALSAREYALLEFLMLHAGGYYTRDVLLEHVWSANDNIDPRTVDTYIRYLRRKLGNEAIETVPGLGYCLRG